MTAANFSLEIARTSPCARLAREAIRSRLPESKSRDSLETIASELVTNAFVHGTGPIVMTVTCQEKALHISVSNHLLDSGVSLTPKTVTPNTDHGRGLALVELLSQSWEYSVQDSVLCVQASVVEHDNL